MGIEHKLLAIVWKIIQKIKVTKRPKLRRCLLVSSGIIGTTAIVVLSFIGIFNYMLSTSSSSPFIPPYIPPPMGERNYYLEITTEALWDLFLSHYSDFYNAPNPYIGESFIIQNILIDEDKLVERYENYIIIYGIQCIPRNFSDLQELKEGDVIDIIGVCAGPSDKNIYVTLVNCQFLPAGLAPLPLPGGPSPISPSY